MSLNRITKLKTKKAISLLNKYIQRHESFPSPAAMALITGIQHFDHITHVCEEMVAMGCLNKDGDWYRVMNDDPSTLAMEQLVDKNHPSAKDVLSFFGISKNDGLVVRSTRNYPEYGISSRDLLVLCRPKVLKTPLGIRVSKGRINISDINDTSCVLALAGTIRPLS